MRAGVADAVFFCQIAFFVPSLSSFSIWSPKKSKYCYS